MHPLRPYQSTALDAVSAAWLYDRSVLLVAPTGSGKSVMGAAVVRLALARGERVLWVAHRRELLQQAHDHLQDERVRVESVQTLARREVGEWDLVVVDECHHVRAASYRRIVSAGKRVLGLTATPFRLDGRGLGDVFERLVVAAWPDDLVVSGHLVAPRIFAPPAPSMGDVRIRAGDYRIDEIDQRMRPAAVTGDIVATWQRRAVSLPTAVYACTIEHARELCAVFVAAGVRAEHIDGDTLVRERDRVLNDLRTGRVQVVTNCMVLTEGWDFPGLSCVVIARPTASLCLHLQMLGRAMRPSPDGVSPVVLDHAGNVHRHGLPTERVTYSLRDRVRRQDGAPAMAGLRTCRQCYAVFPAHASMCPACGHVHVPEPRPVVRRAGELEEVLVTASPRSQGDRERQAYFAALRRSAKARGYKPGWAAYRYKERYGCWPSRQVLHARV